MKRLKKAFMMIPYSSLCLFFAVASIFAISSCAGTTSVTEQEAYDAGYTIGRLIRGE